MKHTSYRITLMCFFCLLLLAGCAVNESFKLGQGLVNEKRWEEAIVYFEKALSAEPDNQEYKEALKKATSEMAKTFYEKIRQSFAEVKNPNLTTVQQFAKDAERARRLDPDNKDIAAFSSSLNEKVEALKARLKSLYTAADAALQKEDWLTAIDKLGQVNEILLNYEDTSSKLAKANQEATKTLYQQGLELAKQEDWKLAAQRFKTVMNIDPNYSNVTELYRDAQARDNIDYFLKEAQKADLNQIWDRAIMMLVKAREYQPDNRDLLKKIESIKGKVGQLYFTEAVKLVDQNMLHMAMAKLDGAKSYMPEIESDPSYDDFVSKFCGKLLERADKLAEKELWGNALIWLQKAEALSPNYPNLFQKLLEAKDHINKRIRQSIAVFDFGAPSNNKDAGKIAANKLIAFLHKNASGDLRIIERENLQSILTEMQLGQTGLVDVKSTQAAKMRGIDTFIMGEVLHYSANFVDRASNAQEKVLVDEEDVRNPEFSDWLMMHPKPTHEDLQNAPPRTVKKRNYQLLSYKKGVATVTAMIEFSYKLIDTTTGENVFTRTIAGKSIKEDKYSEGLTIANIPSDPLEIPTEGEVLDELTNEKTSEVGQNVLKQYQSLEVEYFNQGQALEKRRNFDLAVEKYIDAIFDERLKGITTPISQKSREFIERMTENN